MKILKSKESIVVYIRYATDHDEFVALDNTEKEIDALAQYLADKILNKQAVALVRPVYQLQEGVLTSDECLYCSSYKTFTEEINKRVVSILKNEYLKRNVNTEIV